MTSHKAAGVAGKLLEEEPPGAALVLKEEEEPPPIGHALNTVSISSQVPEKLWNDWKWHFRHRITSVKELSRYIPLSVKEQTQIKLVSATYPFAITPYYLSLIDPRDRQDPIRQQAVPCYKEISQSGMGIEDPLGEGESSVMPGLVHRYPDRVLMVLTDVCPMFCRHCTRKREWRHGNWVRTPEEVESMLAYIRRQPSVRDIVISGGDVLTLSTARLEGVIAALRRIPHVEIIRIGSRFPVVLPQRIDDELCDMLSRYGPIWFNTHFNHPREVTPEAAAACQRLVRSGVPVNNQSVLLRGINDTPEIQTRLCHRLLQISVRPYYLFQCDEVRGTEHLRTPVETGIRIIEAMRGHTSGLAIPSYVIDLPDGGGKVPIQPDYLLSNIGDVITLRNYEGRVFKYRNPRNGRSERNGSSAAKRNGPGVRVKVPAGPTPSSVMGAAACG